MEGIRLQRLSRLVEATKVLEETIGCIHSEFQRNQPINVYGVTASRYEYINTCEVYELGVLLSCVQADWWESFAIELIDKPGRVIPFAEVLPFLDELPRPTQLDKTRVKYRQYC